jgi:gamma-glutamyltranspeptidase/glutathione hydrolase
VDAPRLHHQWLPDEICHEPGGLDPAVMEMLMDRLKAMGHRFADRAGSLGDARGIMVEPISGARLGASDRRGPDGEAAGY